MPENNKFMNIAFEEAFKAMRENLGGPFGAIVVKNGDIIAKGSNRVYSDNDPTAHAEITAIRSACKALESFDLSGAVIYSTSEPCPMCLSAIYWANIEHVYYVLNRRDTEDMGFKDDHIYHQLSLDPAMRETRLIRLDHNRSYDLSEEWKKKQNRIIY